MVRALHRWPGLIAAVFVSVLGLSGAALSVFPVLDSVQVASTSGTSLADLAARVLAANPGVTEIDRAPSGQITAFVDSLGPVAQVIDPATGASLGDVATSPTYLWLVELHRSLFLSDAGRIGLAVAALAMLVLAGSGLALLARRSGGWSRLFTPQKGKGALHATLARAAVLGLILSSVTALWMSAATFDLLPSAAGLPFPAAVSGLTGTDLAAAPALQAIPAASLTKLVFPMADDPTDVFTLTTTAGHGYLDQGTGQVLSWADPTVWDQLSGLMVMLHTGRGMAWLGAVLGLCALAVPAMSWTGARQYLARRGRKSRHSVPADQAEVIVLVGSEGGTTWGFAETLRAELAGKGLAVHVTDLANFAPDAWPKAELALILAATYGDGAAPHTAKGVIEQLRGLEQPPMMPLAVLGFGDRSFAQFCGFATDLSAAAKAIGWRQALPMATVDRQSAQDFARWGKDLSAAVGLDLVLHHAPEVPATQPLTLISRRDYGQAVQAPTAILRFALPQAPLWRRMFALTPRFQAGDLLGVLPEGSAVPRFYSLASGQKDGFVEICVRKHPGGLCSPALLELEPGGRIHAFLRPNPGFRLGKGKVPVILIGAGTGIGPLAGFVRANDRRRPMHLYFGLRHPSSDWLYGAEIEGWQQAGRLASVQVAASRGGPKTFVQDAVRRDADRLAALVAQGARIMVCGGRDMAAGVREAWADILAPLGLSLAVLKAEGRYAEDVY